MSASYGVHPFFVEVAERPKTALRDHIRDHNWAGNVVPYEFLQKNYELRVGFVHRASSRLRRNISSVVWMYLSVVVMDEWPIISFRTVGGTRSAQMLPNEWRRS